MTLVVTQTHTRCMYQRESRYCRQTTQLTNLPIEVPLKSSEGISDTSIVTDNHLEPPLEKVNKELVFRNPTVRTFLNKSTLRTLTHLEPYPTQI